ncbi:hypothetical protein C1H46_006067 [Malus baccata]|uniref:PsbP C-terminal domain-containing protein n=1 Tax=Malus baccata TaxID=106549 RepID=A0A540NB59_MALBA|nr:hypothetical protein C1H46_006067 [Malus baccata]
MATMFSPSTFSSTTTNNITSPKPPQTPLPPKSHIPIPPSKPLLTTLTTTLTVTAAAAAILTASPPSLADSTAETTYQIYYGTAASAANYGSYGGNSDKKASADEFYNPKKKSEKEYLTFLSGFNQLAPKDAVLNNLALSDVNLQDLLASPDNVISEERKDEKGQVYYVYEIDGVAAHSLISVTCARNKLYAHFVNAPTTEWNRDHDLLQHVHESFKTTGSF